MTAATFDGTATVSARAGQVTSTPYRVVVGDGRLRLALEAKDGAVLDVPAADVEARPLGRAGATMVVVGESEILIDFTRRGRPASAFVPGTARRIVHGLSGRLARHRFVTALRGSGR
jgi:hypothetical protein